ncbi:MAG: hypothetical protein IJC26_00965 [Clostridia bacterium]|nr:hypothetical protein [Clostridia bacterium]
MILKEEALSLAKEKIAEAAEALEEVLPDTSEELVWLGETVGEELLAVRTACTCHSDGVYEEGGVF